MCFFFLVVFCVLQLSNLAVGIEQQRSASMQSMRIAISIMIDFVKKELNGEGFCFMQIMFFVVNIFIALCLEIEEMVKLQNIRGCSLLQLTNKENSAECFSCFETINIADESDWSWVLAK
jgi:hypothetical protein